LHPGGEARRASDPGPVEGMEALRRAAERHRNVQALLTRAEDHPEVASALAGQLTDLVSDLDEPEAGQVLYRLARRYHESGRWEQAAEMLALLADKYPNHAFTPTAQVWLVRYWSSSEASWRIRSTQRFSQQQTVPTAAQEASPTAAQDTQDNSPSGKNNSPVRAAGFEVELREASSAQLNVADLAERAAMASSLARQVERMNPVLYNDPQLRFPLSVAQRTQGFGRQAERFFLTMRRGHPDDAWRSCAEAERWLETPTGQPPKGLARCRRAATPPKLDGRLDDPIWSNAQVIELHSPLKDDADWPAIAFLAHDGEFLYLAVHCRQAAGATYKSSDAPRPRDPDLSRHDRVSFHLDMDRDWATFYRLTVDHRGWTGEDCWGDRTWNPQWFVAAHTDAGDWSAEAAIPWTELADRVPQPKHVWALGVQRIVPGVGLQSWTTPAAVEARPEGFGLLLFE
jgi:hypothetical protein